MTDEGDHLASSLRAGDDSLDDQAFTRQVLRRAHLPRLRLRRPRSRLLRVAVALGAVASLLAFTPAGARLGDLFAGLGPLGPALLATAALTWAASALGGQ